MKVSAFHCELEAYSVEVNHLVLFFLSLVIVPPQCIYTVCVPLCRVWVVCDVAVIWFLLADKHFVFLVIKSYFVSSSSPC